MHVLPVQAVSLMISEATRAVCAVESMHHQWKQFRCIFLRPQGLFPLSNPCVTRGSSFDGDFGGRRGCLRCRIHASLVEAVSVVISEAGGAVCAVESMRHQWKEFR